MDQMITAKYAGYCGRCGCDVVPGQTIHWSRGGRHGRTRCVACHTMDMLDLQDRAREPRAESWEKFKADLARSVRQQER